MEMDKKMVSSAAKEGFDFEGYSFLRHSLAKFPVCWTGIRWRISISNKPFYFPNIKVLFRKQFSEVTRSVFV